MRRLVPYPCRSISTQPLLSRLRACAFLVLIASLLIVAVACKRPRKDVAMAQEESPGLSSVIQVADSRKSPQLLTGFHQVEANAWRWTADSFSVLLQPPRAAGQNGARLILKFMVAERSIQTLHSLRLSADVNGLALPPVEYTRPGDYTYSQDVPATALQGDAVKVSFKLDKFLPPGPNEPRPLGVVVSTVGLEAR